ncbi:LysR substrate-binding domain-containing protein [Phenylobacterium sp. LjRoot164]|uniref:LysR substrate-binding domain-containing protein n=1 Tax=unclassified Phenylobacterium TaxID=2640670 RepID=UPI003ECD982E
MIRLPPFFALRALAAAARRRSYSRAAEDLAVTHGAVSQQIRKLEAELGARLFVRQGNAMIPTAAAERLAGEVERALGVLQAGVADFRRAADHDPLVVSLDPQLAARWLPARLPRLLADPAGANIDFIAEERMANFVTDGVDVGVRYGLAREPGLETALLFRERLFPVASPALAAAHDISTPADLLTAPLLRHRHRPWSVWFGAFGLEDPGRGIELEDSIMLLESAAQGMGVALARGALVEQDLASGRLVQVLPQAVGNEFAFYLVWRGDNPKLHRIHALRDWLTAEAARGQP